MVMTQGNLYGVNTIFSLLKCLLNPRDNNSKSIAIYDTYVMYIWIPK